MSLGTVFPDFCSLTKSFGQENDIHTLTYSNNSNILLFQQMIFILYMLGHVFHFLEQR